MKEIEKFIFSPEYKELQTFIEISHKNIKEKCEKLLLLEDIAFRISNLPLNGKIHKGDPADSVELIAIQNDSIHSETLLGLLEGITDILEKLEEKYIISLIPPLEYLFPTAQGRTANGLNFVLIWAPLFAQNKEVIEFRVCYVKL